jgi:hypothetical protein
VVKARGMDDVLLGIVLERLEKYPLAADPSAHRARVTFQQLRDLRRRQTLQRQQPHHRPGRLPPPAPQAGPQLLNLTAWAFANTQTGRILTTTSPGGRAMEATSIQPTARLMSTPRLLPHTHVGRCPGAAVPWTSLWLPPWPPPHALAAAGARVAG